MKDTEGSKLQQQTDIGAAFLDVPQFRFRSRSCGNRAEVTELKKQSELASSCPESLSIIDQVKSFLTLKPPSRTPSVEKGKTEEQSSTSTGSSTNTGSSDAVAGLPVNADTPDSSMSLSIVVPNTQSVRQNSSPGLLKKTASTVSRDMHGLSLSQKLRILNQDINIWAPNEF